jgi:thiamine pyrophosphokinase
MKLGVVFSGGEGPSAEKCRRIIAGAQSRPGSVIAAADSGLDLAEAAGLRPDWVAGDFDSLVNKALLQGYPPERVISLPRDKDDSDTEFVLHLLAEKTCEEAWLIGGGGGRLDHTLAIRALFDRQPRPDSPLTPGAHHLWLSRWWTAGESIYCIDAAVGDGGAVFHGSPGQTVSLFPIGHGFGCTHWKAESRGLKWPLESVDWKSGFFSLSNTAPDGNFSVQACEGRFLLIITHNV